jgi:hypothetical protein
VSLVVLSAVLVLFGLAPALAITAVDTTTVTLLERLGARP